jgi:hypothetical protein
MTSVRNGRPEDIENMKKLLFVLFTVGSFAAFSDQTCAQRKAVSGAEVTGTFRLVSDQSRSAAFKILALGGGKLKVEFVTSLRLGADGDARGNVGLGSGTAFIYADEAFFTPEGQDAAECFIKIKFVKPGTIKIAQDGNCGFINDFISTEGTYKKISSKKPSFDE